jgi:hypothetical protein
MMRARKPPVEKKSKWVEGEEEEEENWPEIKKRRNLSYLPLDGQLVQKHYAYIFTRELFTKGAVKPSQVLEWFEKWPDRCVFGLWKSTS